MRTSVTIVRITGSAAVGVASAAVGGAWLGHLYDSLAETPILRIPGLNEIAFGVCFGCCGLAIGIVVGAAKLGRLSAIAVGFALGVVVVVCWVSFVIAVVKRPDQVILIGAIPNLAVAGLLSAIVSRTISNRFN
jgi:hypothetical protein